MTTSEIHKICKEHDIKYYTINDDMSISVDGDVSLSGRNLKSIPITFKEVGSHFYCGYNQLTSLKGCPETVGGHFFCNNNQLTSLRGCPETVGGYFSCRSNQLTSLKYCPETVGGDFYCHHNQLTSLKYCPETVGGYFYCDNNQLTSLKYCPETVGGDFYCNNNQLTNFDGLPEFFEQDISLIGNPVNEIYELFNEDPRCIYWIREFGVIQGDEVVRDRLEEVYHTLGMDIPKDIKLSNYNLV